MVSIVTKLEINSPEGKKNPKTLLYIVEHFLDIFGFLATINKTKFVHR